MNKLEQIVTALVALAKATPDVYAVAVMIRGERTLVRLSPRTDDGFAALVASFGKGVRLSVVSYEDSEWDVGEVMLDGKIALEISGRHRPVRKVPVAEPATVGPEADTALAQAEGALS